MNTAKIAPAHRLYRGADFRNGFELRSQYIWDQNLNALKAFVDEHGRLPARENVPADEVRLGMWISWNNRQYRIGGITKQQREQLINVHPDMKARMHGLTNDERWAKHLEDLNAFAKRSGRMPRRGATNRFETQLESWVSRQRQKHRNEQLSQDRINMIANSHPLLAKRFGLDG